MNNSFDVIIIGAGVVGCAIARELAKYKLSILVLEKESDVAAGTSGRNSGVVHSGLNYNPKTIKSGLCVEGCLSFAEICNKLDVPFKRTGKLIIGFNKEDLDKIKELFYQGKANGVPGLEIIEKNEIKELEPNINGEVALYSPYTGITNPLLFTIALAENAFKNGACFKFNSKVTNIRYMNKRFIVETEEGMFFSDKIINSAGLYSDQIANMLNKTSKYKIYPCRGEYYILDKRMGKHLKMPVYPVPRPGSAGLGVHLTPTIDGNILLGPSAEYIFSKEDYSTTRNVMNKLYEEARTLLPIISKQDFIRNYSGIRPKLAGPDVGGFKDFVIEKSREIPGLINLIGIESPGLTAAVPIARRIAHILDKDEGLVRKKDYKEYRKGIIRFKDLSIKEQNELIKINPSYGEIICRCEKVTKQEIIDAINNPLGVRTLTGIKYRARARMGRCQGGYCLPKIVEIMINEIGMNPDEIVERNQASYLFTGRIR